MTLRVLNVAGRELEENSFENFLCDGENFYGFQGVETFF
jgi:hypothetical protein